jgi:hypothetical protein
MKRKTKYTLLSIFSFGIYPLYVHKMAKKVINKENNKLASSSKIDFDIDEFFNILGKKENIKSIVSNYTSVKIEFFPPFV